MGRINSVIAAILLLAVLILPGLNGQQAPTPAPEEKKQEKELPPLKAQCQALEEDFVRGQNVELRCYFLFRNNVNINFDDLKKGLDENFALSKFSITQPTPVPLQKDYSYSVLTEVLRPNPNLKYGRYTLRLSLRYQYPESVWQEQEGKKILQTKVVSKIEKLPPVTFEKVPLFARVDGGEGFQDVVNIGEHIQYFLHIFYEKNAVVLLNDQAPVELDRKYSIRDATQLDNPNLKPFSVINKDDPGKREQIDRGLYIERIYKYKLVLYDVSLVKMFEIPPINLYYTVGGINKAKALSTPVIKIRTNSVLNQDSDFRPLKNMLKSDPDKSRKFGSWPIKIAYGLSGLAGLIIIAAFLTFIVRRIKAIYKKGLLESIFEVKKSFVVKIGRWKTVARIRATRALEKLKDEPSQENLKRFIKELRLYMAVVSKTDVRLALSLTAQEFHGKINAEILENAEYLLDEDVTPEDVAILKLKFRELVLAKKGQEIWQEVGTWS